MAKPDDDLHFMFLVRALKAQLGCQISQNFLKESGWRRSRGLCFENISEKSWKEIIHPISVFLSKEEDFNLHKLEHELDK